MAANIKSPYTQTPYDMLSDAGNPKVGIVTPASRRSEIRAQYNKVVVARGRVPLEVINALTTLLNVAGRLKCDAFLATLMVREETTPPEDAAKILRQYRRPPAPEAPLPDWTENLTWLQAAPAVKISRQEQSLETEDRYNLPETKPPILGFES